MRVKNLLSSPKVDEKRLLAYAAAAGALLAVAAPTDASVVYGTVANGTVGLGSPVSVIFGAGTAFSFNLANANSHLYGNVKGIGSGASVAKYGSAGNPKALRFAQNASIGSAGKYHHYNNNPKLFGNIGTSHP